jgi:hypothetical protein
MGLMQRREFLEAIAGISASVVEFSLLAWPDRVAFAQGVHARAKAAPGLRALNREQGALVTSIAEALLPRTETVGATDVGVTRFIDLLLTESMLERDRDRFFAGLAAIDAKSQSLHGAVFLSIHREEQQSLLAELDSHLPPPNPTPAEAAALAREPMSAERAFWMLKRLAVFAYFTSEAVAKDLIKAPIIPGRYDGCVPV